MTPSAVWFAAPSRLSVCQITEDAAKDLREESTQGGNEEKHVDERFLGGGAKNPTHPSASELLMGYLQIASGPLLGMDLPAVHIGCQASDRITWHGVTKHPCAGPGMHLTQWECIS